MRYILALDQGTTSSRALLFDLDSDMAVVGSGQRRLPMHYPEPGWAEQDAEDIWASQWGAVEDCLHHTGVSPLDIVAVGIANQRETLVVWEKATGRAVAPAISWQCRRSAARCQELLADNLEPWIQERTGLVLDPYFPATKLSWLLESQPGLRPRAEAGELLAGTVDSWLVYRLTGGTQHLTDVSNASRTMLFNIHRLDWDADLLKLFNVPRAMLPTPVDSSGVMAITEPQWFSHPVPVAGIAGDQQASLFGHGGWCETGPTKVTYGTGAFVLTHTGTTPVTSRARLLTTVAWKYGGVAHYALEGSVFIAGAVIQWLRDDLGLLASAEESERCAEALPDTDGVVVVPAFAGLGAPHWDSGARGMIVGLTRNSGKAHIIRAALESIAYQVDDVLEVMKQDLGSEPGAIAVDGGAIANDFLAQFQADISAVTVRRAATNETTARGAAGLAAMGVGEVTPQQLGALWSNPGRTFFPNMPNPRRQGLRLQWKRARERAMGWVQDPSE